MPLKSDGTPIPSPTPHGTALIPCSHLRSRVQQTDEGYLKVLGVVNGSDLNVGDLLLTINGQVVHGKPKEEVASLLQGRAGSSVIVDVKRSGQEQPVRVKLTRHYKAKKGATRQRRGNGARTPTSPGRVPGAAGFGSQGVPTPPSSHGSAPPPALQRPVLDQNSRQASTEQSFDPEASMRSDKSFGLHPHPPFYSFPRACMIGQRAAAEQRH